MCGIAGMVGFCDDDLLVAMTRALAHRGPDGEGFFREREVGLGHRRLAIVDLAGGAQPMSDVDENLHLAFNGEVFNYEELRRALTDYPFRTRSDTEVLLASWRREGAAALPRLRGQFAIALWDRSSRTLYLARDQLGQKPLYYAVLPPSPEAPRGALLFASEPKALLRCGAVDRGLDLAALDAYLDLFYVPPPRSIFAGIRQLPPGHLLTWRDGQLSIVRWWDCEPRPPDPRLRTLEAWAEAVAPTLEEAIALTTVADVPVGAFLSGGLDSSTIVAAIAHRGARINTFCVGYGREGASYEERPLARVVAERFGALHRELELDVDVLAGLPALVRAFDEPFGSWAALLSYNISRFAREHVTVALAGDGGDEVFGGYPRYRGLLLSEHVQGVPATAQNLARRALRALGEPTSARSLRRWARQFLDGCSLPPSERYAAWVGYAPPDARDRLYTPATRARVAPLRDPSFVAGAFDRPVFGDLVARACYADLHGFLPENVLRGSDRMSMAHSLEVRVPFCDPRLLEQMAAAPTPLRVTMLASKRILRKIAGTWLPPEVLARKKLGFNAPFGTWLKDLEARVTREWLHPDVIARRGLFDPSEIQRLLVEHRRGVRDHGVRLWSLLVLEEWFRTYMDDQRA